MRDAFISILTMLALLTPVKSSDFGKDGFNFYKDYLRARSDEGMAEGIASGDRTVYYYRTPLQVYPGLLPALEQEYKKRTANVFKNHMLSKELLIDEQAPMKRSSKAALALMLQSKHPGSNIIVAFSENKQRCLYSSSDTMPAGYNLE